MQIFVDKVKEMHQSMETQGCEDEFEMEGLIEMARKMTTKETKEELPVEEANECY